MSKKSDLANLPKGLDRIRVEKADGCVWEYQVRGLRLESIGVPEEYRQPGQSIGNLSLEAQEVFEMRECGQAPQPLSCFDHISLRVRDLEASRAFYTSALTPLGYQPLYEDPGVVGFGMVPGDRATFWLMEDQAAPSGPMHLCFQAKSRAVVDEFYQKALAHGGRCNGAPGIRSEYSPGYYAAFVFGPEGINLELVFRDP